MPPARLDWEWDGRDWPNRAASRFVGASELRWHVQIEGEGPDALLLHGTGASTHSWRGLLPLLSQRYRVIAPDLPGHGFTDPLPYRRLTLPGMAAAVGGLARKLGADPKIIIGHSAGAAIAIRMALDGLVDPRVIVSLNGALFPIAESFARPLFEGAAKLLAMNPVVPWLFALRARDPAAVRRLLSGTGSEIAEDDERIYRRLAATPSHVAGALGMMAGWDLPAFRNDLPKLEAPLTLVVGEEDAMVPPARAEGVRRLVKRGEVIRLKGLGHLAHEQDPATIAAIVERVMEPVHA